MPSEDRRVEISPDRRIGNPRPIGRTLPVIPASGHGIVSDVRTRIVFEGPGSGDDTIDPPPFFPVAISQDGGSFEVTLQPGSVASWDPHTGADTLDLHIPLINGTPMNEDPRPTIFVGEGQWVSVKIKTDLQNLITETPEILAQEGEGTHYIPDVADTAGSEGEYLVKLFKLELLDDAIVITSGVQSDILLSPYLWTGENSGGGTGRVLKDYNAAASIYRFRTLEYGYGTEVVQEGDLIRTRFYGDSVGSGAEIYVPPEDPVVDEDPAKFNTIDGRQSGDPIARQISVDPAIPPSGADPGTPIIVKGNGMSGSRTFTRNGTPAGSLTWVDGLITDNDDLTIELCCEGSTETPGP